MTMRSVTRAGAVSAGVLALVLGGAGAALADTGLGGLTTTATSTVTTVTSTTTDVLPLPTPTPTLLDAVTTVLPTVSPSPLPTTTVLDPVTTLLTTSSSAPQPTTSTVPGATSLPTLPGGSAPTSSGTGASEPTTSGTSSRTVASGLPTLTTARTPAKSTSQSSYLPDVMSPLPGMANGARAADRIDSYAVPQALGELPALAAQPIQLAAGSAPALAPVPNLPAPLRIARGNHDERTILGGLAVIIAMVAVGSLSAGHLSVWLENRRRKMHFA